MPINRLNLKFNARHFLTLSENQKRGFQKKVIQLIKPPFLTTAKIKRFKGLNFSNNPKLNKRKIRA